MGSEINIVIDNLCDKLGTTVENLIPELARYHIAKDAVGIVICVVAFLLGANLIHRSSKIEEYGNSELLFAGGAFVSGVAVILAIILILTLTGWLASPTAAGISSLMNLLN